MPLLNNSNPDYLRIMALLNAVKRVQGTSKRLRHPITADILFQMCYLLQHGYSSHYINSLPEAGFLSCYCGFLRCGEITVSRKTFDPNINLCINDVIFYENKVELNLKISKTDPYKHGICISLFKNDSCSSLCPLIALSRYFELHNKLFPHKMSQDSPFFLTESGESMSRSYFVAHIKAVLVRLQCFILCGTQFPPRCRYTSSDLLP